MIAFNRDESLWRTALPLNEHENRLKNDGSCTIYHGTDKRTGTTWFGYNKTTGRFAFLTNYRLRASEVGIPG